jgi:hypothetical protein
MLREKVTREPAREVELRLSLASAPARMVKILEATGEGMRPGCLMKILEAERWLKGTNFHEVAFLQRQSGRIASVPHPGARKVERRDA